jgi:hypothetical protein
VLTGREGIEESALRRRKAAGARPSNILSQLDCMAEVINAFFWPSTATLVVRPTDESGRFPTP